jgi:hypothetical protein
MTVNTIVNGGFETGDFTGWTSTGSLDMDSRVDAAFSNGSDYGASVECSVSYGAPGEGDTAQISQPLTLDENLISISFDIRTYTSTLPMQVHVSLKSSGNWIDIYSTPVGASELENVWETITITKDEIETYYGITLSTVTDIRFMKITVVVVD